MVHDEDSLFDVHGLLYFPLVPDLFSGQAVGFIHKIKKSDGQYVFMSMPFMERKCYMNGKLRKCRVVIIMLLLLTQLCLLAINKS